MLSKKTLYRSRGIAYIESVLAIFIAFMGASSVLGLLTVSSQAAKSNEYNVLALQIARTEIETVRATKAHLLANVNNGDFLSAPVLTELPSGSAKITISNSALITGAKEVTVTVSWKQPPRDAVRSIQMKTLVTADGITS